VLGLGIGFYDGGGEIKAGARLLSVSGQIGARFLTLKNKF